MLTLLKEKDGNLTPGHWARPLGSQDEIERWMNPPQPLVSGSDDDITHWINKSQRPPLISGEEFVGGLRLLVQRWPKFWPTTHKAEEGKPDPTTGDESTFLYQITKGHKLPFSKDTLDLMLDVLHLPPSYLHDLTGDYAVPLRLKWVNSYLGIVVQSPKYDNHTFPDSFVSAALSYNPVTKVTSGFLGYIYNESDPEDSMHGVLERIEKKGAAILATHPMLLPTFILDSWCDFCRVRLEESRQMLRKVEELHGPKIQENWLENTSSLRSHRSLLNETFHFANGLGISCLEALAKVRSLLEKVELVEEKKIRSITKKKMEEGMSAVVENRMEKRIGEGKWIKGEIKSIVKTINDEIESLLPDEYPEGDHTAEHEIEGYLLHLNSALEAYDHRRERVLSRMMKAFDVVR
jgi:hypothetical protein